MRDFFARASDGADDPIDLDRVRADDALIEALRAPLFDEPAGPTPRWNAADGGFADLRAGSDGADDPLGQHIPEVSPDAQVLALLQAWRGGIDSVPLPAPPDAEVAASILRSTPPRHRSVRPVIAVAAAIAGLLIGSTAIGARSATPDDTLLWPVTQLLWGDRVDEVKASIDARQGIDEASEAIEAGYPDQAEAALDHVTVVITRVADPSESATLKSDLDRVQSQLDATRASSSSNPPVSTTSAAPGTPTTTAPPTSRSTAASVPVPVPPPVVSSAPAPSEIVTPPATPTEVPTPSEPTLPAGPTTVEQTSAEPTPETTPAEDTTPAATPGDVDDDEVLPSVRPDEEPATADIAFEVAVPTTG